MSFSFSTHLSVVIEVPPRPWPFHPVDAPTTTMAHRQGSGRRRISRPTPPPLDVSPGPLLLSATNLPGGLPGRAHRLPSLLLNDPSEVRIEMQDLSNASSSSVALPSISQLGNNRFSHVVRTAMLVGRFMNTSAVEREASTAQTEADHHDSAVFEAPAPLPSTAAPSHLGFLSHSNLSQFSGIKLFFELTKYLLRSFITCVTIFRPTSTMTLLWNLIVVLAVSYNIHACVIFIFNDVYENMFWWWLGANAVSDLVYLLDILFQSRLVYLHEGQEVTNGKMMRRRYIARLVYITFFWLDLFSLAPLDVALIWIPYASLLRLNRCLKMHRVPEFIDISERRMSYRMQNISKIFWLVSYCWVLFHWNACLYYYFSIIEKVDNPEPTDFIFNYVKIFDPLFSSCDEATPEASSCLFNETGRDVIADRPNYAPEMTAYMINTTYLITFSNFSKEYVMSVYWSSMTVTNRGQQPWPATSWQNILEVMDTLIGLIVFATIVGSVGNVVSNFNKEITDYNGIIDGAKFFMNYRNVKSETQRRVTRFLKYLYNEKRWQNDGETLSCLPDRTIGRINIQIHMAEVSRIDLFEGRAPMFIYEVINKLTRHMFAPLEYVCQVGDRAGAMYIIRKGTLAVMSPENSAGKSSVISVLKSGATYGDLSILHLKDISEDRRTTSLKSVGYVELYELTRDDFCSVLKEWPEEREEILLRGKAMHLRQQSARPGMDTLTLPHVTMTRDEITYEGLVAMYSFDEKVAMVTEKAKELDKMLLREWEHFVGFSANCKKKLTSLEKAMSLNGRRIRREAARENASARL